MRSTAFALAAMGILFTLAPAGAVELDIWVLQSELRAANGDPNTSVIPNSLAYNTQNGKLMIACGGASSAYEWPRGSSTGDVIVPDPNWGSAAPYATAYIPSRDAYFIASGGDDDAILEVQAGVLGQSPTVYLTPELFHFPAGGLVSDGQYAYYKSQWTGVEQPVMRFNINGPPATEEAYVSKAHFDAWGLAGPSQELAMNSEGVLYLSGRPFGGGSNTVRGIYYFDEDANDLVFDLTQAEIIAYTGESNVTIYGMTFDKTDALYFYDIYAGAILRYDRFGNLSTFLTNDEVRDFMGDPGMQVHPSYMEVVNDWLVFVSGNVSGHVLAAKLPIAEPYLATVPGTDYEPNGPTYTYHMDKFELTNAEYCMFLNDAELVSQTAPNDPRCSKMFFSQSLYGPGDVFMTDPTVYNPTPNADWINRTLYKTSDIPDSKIKYDATRAPGSRYYVLDGFDHHPVGTVSWFGAAKFCNWLTVRNGLDASEICYAEGPDREDWIPITASNWAGQGLTDAERNDLVRNYRGYRLPMDGVNIDNTGPGLAHSWNIDANPYNEWYKAAAWDPAAPDTVRNGPGDYEVVQPDHWIFAYGADTYTAADENIDLSNNGFLETTPVGWYNGVNLLDDLTPTNDTANRYGMYDMMGNVSEWITDTSLVYPWDSTYRGSRGGRFTATELRWASNTYRLLFTARYYAENSVGFRIMRSAGFGDFDGDDAVDGGDVDFFLPTLTGPGGLIPAGLGYEQCDADGDADIDLSDVEAMQAAVGT